MTEAQATESPRRVTFAPEVTDSPKSVVWEDPPLLPPDSFDDHDHEASLELPSLSQISANLQKLVMQSAHSKASYRAKLGKLAKELQDANRSVQVIEQELRTARERQSTVQRAIEEAKQRREEEAERLNLRRLQLQVMGRCMVDMEFLADIQDIQEKESNNTDKYERLSSLELAVVRQRLEEIRAMLDKADKAKTSKGYDSAQSETLRREAVSTFVLFHKFSQI